MWLFILCIGGSAYACIMVIRCCRFQEYCQHTLITDMLKDSVASEATIIQRALNLLSSFVAIGCTINLHASNIQQITCMLRGILQLCIGK